MQVQSISNSQFEMDWTPVESFYGIKAGVVCSGIDEWQDVIMLLVLLIYVEDLLHVYYAICHLFDQI